jgi:hypothetical protein
MWFEFLHDCIREWNLSETGRIMDDRRRSARALLVKISNILEDMHCSGCIADMHCDFMSRHVKALQEIDKVLQDYGIETQKNNRSEKMKEEDIWNG